MDASTGRLPPRAGVQRPDRRASELAQEVQFAYASHRKAALSQGAQLSATTIRLRVWPDDLRGQLSRTLDSWG